MTGSDCCEDSFSEFSTWGRNTRNITFGDFLMKLPRSNRVNEIRANPLLPIIPKGHKKQENIWLTGTDKPDNPPDLTQYPSDAQLVAAWEEGLVLAQQMARDIGKCD